MLDYSHVQDIFRGNRGRDILTMEPIRYVRDNRQLASERL